MDINDLRLKRKLEDRSFVPRLILETKGFTWEPVNPEGEDWLKAKTWTNTVESITRLTGSLVLVTFRKEYYDDTTDTYMQEHVVYRGKLR